jgi:CDP-diacylglycerol--glycerol-3-phosphate 3-phosphatidyltransferase
LTAFNDPRSISPWLKISAVVKIMLMPVILQRLFYGTRLEAVGVILAITLIALFERLSGTLPNRVFSAMTNRFSLIPVLICLSILEIHLSFHFPILLIGGSFFIALKEGFFIYKGYLFLFEREEYNPPRTIHKINAVGWVVVVILYALRWEPFNNLAMMGLLLISIIDILAFLWSNFKRKRGMKDINLATRITLMRLLLSPAFLVVYFYDRNTDFSDNSLVLQVMAILFALFFIVTDGLDGYFARKRNEVTKLGKYLDPFSDKICTMTIFLCFVANNYVPVWMVALIYYREASISVIRTLAAAENVVIAARPSGKWKTGLQGTAILTILILATVLSELARSTFPSLYPDVYADLLFIWNYVPLSLITFVTLVTVLSGLDYILASRDILDKYFR